jgi:type IV pilus assembly protein PilN
VIRINLAPVETRRRHGPSFSGFTMPALPVGLGLLFAVVYVVAVLAVGYSWWSLVSEKSRLIAENDRTAKEIDTLKALLGEGANVKAQLADVRSRVKVIEELVQGQGRPVVLLDAFVDTVPRDLWITSFEDKGSSLKIVGTAYSTRAVSEFMNNLRQSGKFKDVDILISRQDLTKSPIMVTFELTCRFEA